MKQLIFSVLLIVVSAGSCVAADVYPRQPKLNAAHNALMAARRKLDRLDVAGGDPRPKILNEAVVALNAARTNLDDAAKNKGSHRTAAIARIDKAKELIEKLRKGSGSVSTVVEEISGAVTDVKEAAKAGRS